MAGESLQFDSVLDDIVKRYGSFDNTAFSLRDKQVEVFQKLWFTNRDLIVSLAPCEIFKQ
jgi:hypothetical protein